MALFADRCGLLMVGDYLSDVEMPMISAGGSVAEYRATLARLAPLVEGRGAWFPATALRTTARRRYGSSTRTWTTWTRWSGATSGPPCPEGRASRTQRRIHADNLARAQ